MGVVGAYRSKFARQWPPRILTWYLERSALLANSLVRGSAEDFKKAIADLKSVFSDALYAHGFSVNDYRICIIFLVEITLVC